MNTITLENAVKSTIQEVLCLDNNKIEDSNTIEQLGFDSMDFLDFVYRLEEKTNKKIDTTKIEFKKIEKLTIQDLICEINKI